ncbi:DUF2314 domain-containing protein [Prosthecobacter sp.]|uniref:DUF2314 domain-containing protein n=1 Tax=Prosthecobacter sp. TaxID=1965333 RepID=UPI003782EFF1
MKIALLFFALFVPAIFAQSPLAPNAPKDKPVHSEAEKFAALDRAIAPYVAKARATYPDAKKRFLAGLPPRHVFFLTTRLHDKKGNVEQVFIEVRSITHDKVSGIIASDILDVEGFKRGDAYTFAESEMLDWLISKPDGTEEGNVVGNFLDTYQP